MGFNISVVHKLQTTHVDLHKAFEGFEACALWFEQQFSETPHKQGGLYSFAEYVEVPVRRNKHTVLLVHALALDFDGKPWSDFTKITSLLDASGISYWWHTTFSHKGSLANARLRLVVKLSHPVHGSDWPAFWDAAVDALEARELVDVKCSDSCRIYYPPCAPNRDFYQFKYVPNEGGSIDVDLVLQTVPAEVSAASNAFEEVPEGDRADISDSLRATAKGWVHALCAEIKRQPYPGPMYELKRQRVFSIARRAPHIISPQQILDEVSAALLHRYEAHDAAFEYPKAVRIIEQAIVEGMNAPWWPRRQDTQKLHDLTAMGLALRMLDAEVPNKLLWAREAQTWFSYDGARWIQGEENSKKFAVEIADTIELEEEMTLAEKAQARETLERLETDPDKDGIELERARSHLEALEAMTRQRSKFIKACRNGIHISAALDFYQAFPEAQIDIIDFNTHTELFNFKNGVLDLRTLQFRAHSPSDYITAISLYDYDPDAKCPRFEQFLDEITLGDADTQKLLVQAAGYSMTGATKEQKYLLLHGDGSDGKTTLLAALHKAFGHQSGRTSADNFVEGPHGSEKHTQWLMALHDKRFVWAEEPSRFRKFNEALIKDVTGGAPVIARWLYAKDTTFDVKFKLWIAANHLPAIHNTDYGIWRRVAPVHFKTLFLTADQIREEKIETLKKGGDPEEATKHMRVQEKDLLDTLSKEAPGILTMLAKQAQRYLEGEPIMWTLLDQGVADYKDMSNPLRYFLLEHCASKESIRSGRHEIPKDVEDYLLDYEGLWDVSTSALYEAYLETTREPMRRPAFHEFVRQQYKTKYIHGYRMYQGLRLLRPEEKRALKHGVPKAKLN